MVSLGPGSVRWLPDVESRTTGENARGFWVIECRPHIAIKLKRFFERAQKDQRGAHKILDTLETSRDLLWFMERFPLEMGATDRARLERRAKEHVDREIQVATVLDKGPTFSFDLAIPAREYQRAAAELVLRLGGLLVADDAGLGKTATAICMISDPRARPAIVVTLTHLPEQWAKEIGRFAPQLLTHCAKGTKPYRVGKTDVLILRYSQVAGWSDAIAESRYFESVTFDECQELRIQDSQKYRGAKRIADAMTYRLGTSATPVYNYGSEMFSIVECLRPDALGTRAEFDREWTSGEQIDDPRAFGEYVRAEGIMVRRTRKDVARELPAFQKIPQYIASDARAYESVAEQADALAALLLKDGLSGEEKMRASGELSWVLRQATGVAKAPHVAAFVRILVEQGEKVLLFGWHREVYRLWSNLLADCGIQFFTGEESPKQKQATKDAFCTGDCKVLAMSLRAGAGIDGLQFVCRTIVFGELDWSPGVLEQDECRVWRDGQVDPVMAYYLLSTDGADPVMSEVLGLKRAQSEGIRSPNADLIEELQVDTERLKKLAEDWLRRRRLAA